MQEIGGFEAATVVTIVRSLFRTPGLGVYRVETVTPGEFATFLITEVR